MAVSESTMNMALTLHDTLLAFGGVAEAVSVHVLVVMKTTISLSFFLSSSGITREQRNARELQVARHVTRKFILL